jgi:hypothetical protein
MDRLTLFVLFVALVVVAGCQQKSFVETEAQKIAASQAEGPQEQCAVCGRSFPEGSLKPYSAGRACMGCIDASRGD